MNRVYKVIWSKAKHCYVVTSEIAKSHTKGESTGRGLKKLAAALLVAAALMGPNFAWAAGDTVTVKDATEVEQIVYTQKGADDQFATKTDLAAKANAADVENTYAKTADVANTYVNKTDAQVTNLTVYRDVEAYGNLQVGNGNFTVSGITGNVTTGYATIGDDLTVKGDTEMKGDLSVKGTLNAADGKFSVGNDGQLSVSSGKFIVDTNGGINIGHGTATIDNNGNITGKKLDVGDTTVKSLDAGNGLIQTTGTVKAGDVQTGTLKAGATTVDSLDAGSGLIKTNGDISGTNITGTNITGTNITGTNITGDNVVVNDKLTTKNLAVTGGLEMNHITLGSEPTDNYTEINMGNVTSKNSKLSVDDGRTYTSTSNLTEKGRTDTAADGTTTNVSVMTAGGSDSTISSLADKNQKSYITQNMKNILQGIKNGANESIINQTETGIKSIATDTDGKNNASTNLSNKGFNTFASDGGKNKTYTKQTAESLTSQIGDDGKVMSVMNAEGISNNADGGTITNSAKDLVNTASENMTNTVDKDLTTTVGGEMKTTVTGKVTEDYKSDLDTTVGGNETRNVKGTLTETVTGNVTEDYKANLDTTVGGEMKTTVTGKVTEDYKSDLDTTVGGNETRNVKGTLTETVTGNVTEDYKANLDTTVGGNETRTVEGTLTETVTGDVTEDYKANLDTNVTGDSSLKAKNIHNTANEALTNDANTITNKAHESVTTQIGNGTTVKSVMDVNGIANTASTGTITNYAVTITNTGIASVTNQVSDNKVLVDTNQVKSAFGDTIYTTWNADGITNITGNNTVISDNGGTTFANEDAKTPFAEGGKTGTRVNTKITGNKVETGKVLTDFAEVANNLDVGGDLNVAGNIETHDAVLSADSRQVVTGRQLYQTNERVDRLDNRIKKVGANAAALAALRPGDFNPDDKFSIAAGFGSYRNANAAALGLFYRPNENVLLSLGTSFGDGENMVNAGVSVKFGRGKSMAERRKEMADEVSSMRDEMRSQDERIAELEEMLKKQSELIEKLSKES